MKEVLSGVDGALCEAVAGTLRGLWTVATGEGSAFWGRLGRVLRLRVLGGLVGLLRGVVKTVGDGRGRFRGGGEVTGEGWV